MKMTMTNRDDNGLTIQVGAMDELCLHFSTVHNQPEKRTCLLRHPGMESSHCTVILSATADGNLLPPFVIFRPGEDGGGGGGGEAKGEGVEGRTTRSLLSLGMTSGMAGEGVGGSVGELEMAAWLQQVDDADDDVKKW